jgi:hypothetical protein
LISYRKDGKFLVLRFRPEFYGAQNGWVFRKILDNGAVKIRKTFSFEKTHILDSDVDFSLIEKPSDIPDDFEYIDFKLGELKGEYYQIKSSILKTDFDLYFAKNIAISNKCFIAVRDISIWPKVNDLKPTQDIYIGGDQEGAIPMETFNKLIKSFPNSTEMSKYVGSRISSILRDDLDIEKDGEALFNKYMKRKFDIKPDQDLNMLNDFEVSKFKFVGEKLNQMLAAEEGYTEHQWQENILGILRLLFPKYIYVFREGPVIDKIFNTTRSVDFLLIEASGNIDIVEIKKPNDKNIVGTTKYRDNYIPLRDLSGTIMQVEKYIYHLNRSAKEGERKLEQKFSNELPANFKIKITNPKGIIIMGRDHNLTQIQKDDFDIIKRKYNNVIDILTYDDLIRRITLTIEQLEK